MKVLGVSDWIDPVIYSEKMKYRMKDVDMIISCGDISVNYLDFIMSELNKPLLYVVGNHVSRSDYKQTETGKAKISIPRCFKNLHLKFRKVKGILLVGFEGSIWYNGGPFQYRQWEVYLKLLGLLPRMLFNKLVYGRYVDIFVSHAPPYGVGDREDLCHTGLKGFNWFLKTFKPKYLLHGHIHIYDRNKNREIQYYDTKVINCSGYRKIELELDGIKDSSEKR